MIGFPFPYIRCIINISKAGGVVAWISTAKNLKILLTKFT